MRRKLRASVHEASSKNRSLYDSIGSCHIYLEHGLLMNENWFSSIASTVESSYNRRLRIIVAHSELGWSYFHISNVSSYLENTYYYNTHSAEVDGTLQSKGHVKKQ